MAENFIRKHIDNQNQLRGKSLKGYELAGEIFVDAGHIHIGDPCYIYHFLPGGDDQDREKRYAVFESERMAQVRDRTTGERLDGWRPELKKQVHEDRSKDVCDALGGMLISSGYGDGGYPVYIKRKQGRIAEVRIIFIP